VSQTGLDKVVLGGDFNCQCDELSTGFLLKKCLKNVDLVCCDSFVQSQADSLFTHSHSGMAKGSFTDHFCVSRNRLSLVTTSEMITSGINMSDHSLIALTWSSAVSHIDCVSDRPQVLGTVVA